MSWWAGKIRQTWRHLAGRVSPEERAALAGWLTRSQLALFEAMHPADRRHGLDVLASLRRMEWGEPDLLLAGLFHDAGKGPAVGLSHRIVWSLGERYGAWFPRAAARLPGFDRGLELIRDHAERSAELALFAGCSEETAELIRHQAEPRDQSRGEALRLADAAN